MPKDAKADKHDHRCECGCNGGHKAGCTCDCHKDCDCGCQDEKGCNCNVSVKEMPAPVVEPAPLGLIGLAVAALVLAAADLGYSSGANKALMIPWTLYLGATAQLIAGLMEFKRHNIFGATAFTTYAMLWYAVGTTLILAILTDAAIDMRHYGYGLLGFMFFSLILTLGSLMTNKVFIAILISIDGAIATLVLHIFYPDSFGPEPVGVFLVLVSFFSFYGACAILINNMAGKTVFPMGAPLWKP